MVYVGGKKESVSLFISFCHYKVNTYSFSFTTVIERVKYHYREKCEEILCHSSVYRCFVRDRRSILSISPFSKHSLVLVSLSSLVPGQEVLNMN